MGIPRSDNPAPKGDVVKHINLLVEMTGVETTADRLLTSNTFDADSEEFFRKHYRALPWPHLLAWLAIKEPGAQPSRPVAAVADRVAETLVEGDHLLLWQALMNIPSGRARDVVLDHLGPVVPASLWPRLARLGSGGAVFADIARLEADLADGTAAHPHEVLQEGPVPSLAARLFDHKHDDRAVLEALFGAAHDEDIGGYALWVLREVKLLDHYELSSLVSPPKSYFETEPRTWPQTTFRLNLAASWPDAKARRDWFAAYALAATKRGVPWSALWWEIPMAFRDEVALASRTWSSVAPWVIPAILHSVEGEEAWQAVAEIVDLDVEGNDGINESIRRIRMVRNQRPTDDEVQTLVAAFDRQSHAVLVSEMALPVCPPEDFDHLLSELGQKLAWPRHIVPQLLAKLPSTPARAKMRLKHALESGAIWTADDFDTLLLQAGAPEGTEVPLPPQINAESVRRFEVLAGGAAVHRLASRLDDLLEAEHIHEAAWLADLVPELQTETRLGTMRALGSRLPISEMVRIADDFPWLITKDDVVHAAMADLPSWGRIEHLPDYLVEPVIKAVRREPTVEIAQALLDRLILLRMPPRHALALALERLESSANDGGVSPRWLAGKLTSRALWENPGERFVTLYLHASPEGACSVAELCMEAVAGSSDVALVRVMHAVVASAIVTLVIDGVASGQFDRAKNGLTALAHLNVPSHLWRRVSMLRRTELPHDVMGLVEANEALMKRSGKNDGAPLAGLMSALSVLGSSIGEDGGVS